MRLNFPSALLALAVLLCGEVALAQRVVVLEFTGDKKNKVRTQVEGALKKADVVTLVSIAQYKRATKAKKITGARAMGPAGVKAVSKWIKLDAAVEGALGDTFYVRILDPLGNELWSKDLPLTRGGISADNARRLAKAIAAAAQAGAQAPAESEAPKPPPEEAEQPAETAEETQATLEKPAETTQAEGTDAPKEEQKAVTLPEVSLEESPAKTTPEDRERRQREEEAEAHTVTDSERSLRDDDLEQEMRKKKTHRRGPRLIQLQLLATVTWRAYCSRPGVASCSEYDALAEDQQPAGVTVNFSASFPYMGGMVGAELFPLVPVTDSAVNGLGLVGYFGRGFSQARVRSESDVDNTAPREVIALDDSYFGGAVYRFHFTMGDEKAPLVGYVGARGGLMGRSFEVDPAANSPLPGSHRQHPLVGLELSIPLIAQARLEGAGQYFINPRAGIDEIAGYGADATGAGFGFELGFAGDVFGPIGYIGKLRFARYVDSFTGQGNQWEQGGVAEESYAALVLGLTASF